MKTIDESAMRGKAVLVSLNIGIWGANKMDRQVSTELADSKSIKDKKMVRAWKSLLAKNDEYDAIISIHSKARKFHYDNTFAWTQDGQRLLPTRNFDFYMDFMRQAKHQFEVAVAKFIAKYPDLIEAAKTALNSIYKETDYPSADSLKNRFYFATITMPVPAGSMFEAEVDDADAERIRKEIDEQVSDAYRAANQELWERMFATINNMQARLSNPKGVREDSLKNLREMLSLLDRLNVAGDPRLEKLRQQALAQLGTLSAKELNKESDKRESIAAEAKRIEDSMAEFMGAA